METQRTCRLGHTIKIEYNPCRTMNNLFDTLCTNSKVSVTVLTVFYLNQTTPVQYLQLMIHSSYHITDQLVLEYSIGNDIDILYM